MTTRRLVRAPFSMAPNAARVRKLGTAPVPTTARALLRRNTRRVIDINRSLLLAFQSALNHHQFIFSEILASRAADPRLRSRPAGALAALASSRYFPAAAGHPWVTAAAPRLNRESAWRRLPRGAWFPSSRALWSGRL